MSRTGWNVPSPPVRARLRGACGLRRTANSPPTGMRALIPMSVVCAILWMPTAQGSECFSILDADQRNACLASAKNDKSYCFKIKSEDLREGCLAPLKGETYGCFKIQNVDQRNACLGAVKADRSYCFKIKGEDLQKDCLANTPR